MRQGRTGSNITKTAYNTYAYERRLRNQKWNKYETLHILGVGF